MTRGVFSLTASLLAGLAVSAIPGAAADELARRFAAPPPSARPWIFWFWINGNVSKEGITADLDSFQRAGLGGVLWTEVSGPWWAPQGGMPALGADWQEAFRWAVQECRRLGLGFDAYVDFGYGSGGPHIAPENSMQQLLCSEHEVEGGRRVHVALARPQPGSEPAPWLRAEARLPASVLAGLSRSDGYREVAVLAIPVRPTETGRSYRIPRISAWAGLEAGLPRSFPAAPPEAVIPRQQIIDLTGRMDRDGVLTWDAPPGKWLVLRYGHATNLKMTRPSPAAAVGLECDRLANSGIEAHFDGHLKKLLAWAGPAGPATLGSVFIDSWEAGGQNWTATFPAEFQRRRGYDVRPWLPVMSGRVVESATLSARFLWDVRATISELICENYAGRLRQLAQAHGLRLSAEAYGRLCIDNLAYAGTADLPVAEFWARGEGLIAGPGNWEGSSKGMASAAHTYGKPIVGAEAFTSDRGWRDHPFLIKALGDRAFTRGINRFYLVLAAHQPRDDMVPGLTHRRWGQHFQRHNTWWSYSGPWIEYLSRSQFLLQQGVPVADVAYWCGEGAPLNVDPMRLAVPAGYDFDFCSAEIVLRMTMNAGWIELPSGTRYRYLLLPDSETMTLPLARKIRQLVDQGARVIGQKQFRDTPGLTDYPRAGGEVGRIGARLWEARRVTSGESLADVFRRDTLPPDFEGPGLSYIHRRMGATEIYFVSHQENSVREVTCTFRVAGMRPELWDPETGAIRDLPEYRVADGRIHVPLRFEPMQSWFVVFRHPGRTGRSILPVAERNFPAWKGAATVSGSWMVRFDPAWGGPKDPVMFSELSDWSRRPEPGIKYYSGTATYACRFDVSDLGPQVLLDLGQVEVMARVRLNGRECGIVWKPPYRLDIARALRAGENVLGIEVVNLWVNRMIGDEQLPSDSEWKDFETLLEWPEWFRRGEPRSSGRYTFTTARYYTKDTPLVRSGLLGPVTLLVPVAGQAP